MKNTRSIAILLVLLATLFTSPLYAQPPHIQHGSNDFIQYWTAFQLLKRGENFYDPAKLLEEQRKIHPALAEPMRMWNPPWLLLPLAPILTLEFKHSVTAWFACNLILLVTAGLIVARTIPGSRASPILIIFFALLFMPAWETMAFGQISILLAFFVSLLYFAIVREKQILAGFALAALSFKPHLFLPLALAVGWWSFFNKKATILASAALTLTILAGGVVSIFPSAIGYWLAALANPPLHFQVSSLVGFLRTLSHSYLNSPAPSLVWIAPAVALSLTGIWLVVSGKTLDWRRSFMPLLLFSLIISPYAWFSDQSVLIVVQIAIVAAELTRENAKFRQALVLLALVALQVGINLQKYLGYFSQLHYAWFPVGLWAVWILTRRGASRA